MLRLPDFMTIKVVRLPVTYRKAITTEAWTGPWGSRRRREPQDSYTIYT